MSAVVDPTYRPLGLETDLANRNFAGATNPDDLLWVQFSTKAVQNNYETQAQGRPIFRDELWIEIRTPGNSLNIIERPAEDFDKVKFPRQWAYFQQTHSQDGQNSGTPLAQWPFLRPSQIEELKALNFRSVEQIAFASDEQIGRVGMVAGVAPLAFRERAKLYLEGARDNAHAVKQAEENKALKERLEAQEKAQREQEEKHRREMEELRALIAAAAPKRGRPPKAATP